MKTTKPHEHRWVAIKPGFPQKICRCGHMKVGTKTVLLSDFIRYTTTKAPVATGDLGMDVTSGRPQFFQGAAVRDVASLDDITGGTGNIVADAVFTGGTVSPGGAMADVPDGAGFVEIIYAVPANGTYFFDAWGMAQYGGTFPSDGGFEWSCSVNTVDQGYAFPGPFAYTNVSNSVIRGPMNVRMPLSLLAGVNTIRLRYREVGGLPASALFKVATSPVSLALIKRP
jgi:hypothetical protein